MDDQYKSQHLRVNSGCPLFQLNIVGRKLVCSVLFIRNRYIYPRGGEIHFKASLTILSRYETHVDVPGSMKILLVDPDNEFRSTVYRLMSEQACDWLEASTPQELLAIIFDEPIDAVVIAHYLYDESLGKVIKLIRATEGFDAIPIYLITKVEQVGIARQAFELGITEIFNKPDINLIVECFKRIYEFQNKVHEGKVLYIEPEDAKAETVLTILRDVRLRVFHYPTVEKALEALDRTHFDLIITTLIAGGQFTGQHLIRRVRNHINLQKQRIPIIVLSEYYDPARQTECFNMGADDFIQKEFVKQELLPRMTSVLKKSEMINDLKQQAKILQRFAIYDSLSNLYNRRGLMEVATSILREAFATKLPLSLLVVDLDYFKEINDIYGHAEGDNVIKAVSKVFMSNLKESDIAARWGGDEFVVLLPNCNIDEAKLVGERLLLKIRSVRPDSNLSCSIGAAQTGNSKVASINELVEEADKALYQAKTDGRSRVVIQGKLLDQEIIHGQAR